jgi:hypothetical protein
LWITLQFSGIHLSDGAIDSFEPSFVKKDESTTPVMHTFKKFLATQDESISDEEAISRYLDYKADFKKRECQRYFQEHKNEEWYFCDFEVLRYTYSVLSSGFAKNTIQKSSNLLKNLTRTL